MGKLSNLPDPPETLAVQGKSASRGTPKNAPRRPAHSPIGSESGPQNNPGQLSNLDPRAVQRRPTSSEIDTLVARYQAGRTLLELAAEFTMHRRTVAAHLQRHGVPRRVNLRKMSPADIAEAARRYRTGDSLATIGTALHVNAATVRNELHQAGVTIRARRGT